ncbi:MAG: hypothetical protein JXR77_08035, partial [Lentisphaeria bacterium]|nr:hypothetical protein [Lentisphaeria bacterium]
PEHAARIRRLGIELSPALVEPLDVTEGYDRASGVLAVELPASMLAVAGRFTLRLALDFEWTDGKAYHRAPPLGELDVHPFARWVYDAATFAADSRRVSAILAEVAAAHRQAGRGFLADALAREAVRVEGLAGELLAAGRQAEARGAWVRLEELGRAAADPFGTAAYGLLLDAWLRRHPPAKAPQLTLMGVGGALSPEDLEVIRRLGCNTILHTDPAQLPVLRELGFRTAVSTPPVRMARSWAEAHPEQRQERYLLSKPVTAADAELSIELMAPYRRHGFELDTGNDPLRYWRVYDRTAGIEVASSHWRVDRDRERLVLGSPVAGHTYQVAFLVYPRDLHFFHSMPDPIHPGAEQAMLRALTAFLDQRAPHLDVYRPTSLYYPFPSIRADQGMAQWNWWGYQWGAGPVAQTRFEAADTVPFDPAWLVDEGRYGHVNYPPRPEYLAWMRFQQEHVIACARRVVDLAHAHGARVRPFWGDHWIGMEPYLGFFQQTGADEIVKACGSAQVCRMVTDIPADITKIIRFSPWLDWGELFRHPDPPGRIRNRWVEIRRAVLFRAPDGLSWGGETLGSLRNDDLAAAMKAVMDEFRVIHALVGGCESFRHPGKIYVVNAWGRVRSWASWGQINPSQAILVHLTDLPFDIGFLSLAEIRTGGVPADARVLLNAGEAGSAWSGGHHWQDAAVAEAITRFVENGGGLVGIDAPSACPGPGAETSWRLAHLFGLDQDGYTDTGAAAGSFTPNDRMRLGVPTAAWTGPARRTAAEHWLAPPGIGILSEQRANVRVKPVSGDVVLVYSGDGQTFAPPVVTAREAGPGRVVYLSGFSAAPDYGEVLRRALFWAGGAEGLYPRLLAEPAHVRTVLYPEQRLLLVSNPTAQALRAAVRLDPALLGPEPAAPLVLRDVLSDVEVARLPAVDLAAGMILDVGPRTVRFLRVGEP